MSSNKYYGRTPTIITRDNGSFNKQEDTWFAELEKNLATEAAKSKKEDYALFDQINRILGNTSKYSTVEEAVQDMKTRTGLTEYLKQAQATSNIFTKIPELKTFIDNYVQSRPGTSVEAVVHDLLKIKSVKDNLPGNDDVPDEIRRYINDKIAELHKMNPNKSRENNQLGKVDVTTDDNVANDNNPFSGCEPARK